ncbi:hydrogenase maturation protein HypF [Streptomyces clavuligerus]|nr:hydrogenase maturation protein HypF [Streptomyces clavuligerus]
MTLPPPPQWSGVDSQPDYNIGRYKVQEANKLEAAAYAYGPPDPPAPGSGSGPDSGHGPGCRFALTERDDGRWTATPAPVLAAVVDDLRSGAPAGLVAARFHAGVTDAVRRLCGLARDRHGLDTVALTGGVFGNALLLSSCTRALAADGFTVLRHRRVPPNDGGLALGQLMVAARATTGEEADPCAWRCPAE